MNTGYAFDASYSGLSESLLLHNDAISTSSIGTTISGVITLPRLRQYHGCLMSRIPTSLSCLNDDNDHRTVTDAQIACWDSKVKCVSLDSVGNGRYLNVNDRLQLVTTNTETGVREENKSGVAPSLCLTNAKINAAATAICGKIDALCKIAKSGMYADLKCTPIFNSSCSGTVLNYRNVTIRGNVLADWNEDDSTMPSYINNKPILPTLCKVATTGNYDDLKNKLPIAYAIDNSASDSSVPTSLATRDAIQSAVNTIQSNIRAVAITGLYDDLTCKPVLDTDNNTSLSVNNNEVISSKISLHKIAKTGKFADLVDGPNLNDYATKIDISSKADKANTYTKTEVNGLLNDKQNTIGDIATIRSNATHGENAYNSLPDIYQHTYCLDGRLADVENLIESDNNKVIDKFNEIVDFLDGISNTDTLDGIVEDISTQISSKASKSNQSIVDNQITIDTANGTSSVKVPTRLNQLCVDADNQTVTAALKTAWNNKQNAITNSNKLSASLVSGLATIATTGSYNDLTNKPSIPTESTVSGWGFTKNVGTVTGVTTTGRQLSIGPNSNGLITLPEADSSNSGVVRLSGTTNDVSDYIVHNYGCIAATQKDANELYDYISDVEGLIVTSLAGLSSDSTHRTVTDAEKSTWNNKQNAITSSNKLNATLISNVDTWNFASANDLPGFASLDKEGLVKLTTTIAPNTSDNKTAVTPAAVANVLSSAISNIQGALCTVATTGNYWDLRNKPTVINGVATTCEKAIFLRTCGTLTTKIFCLPQATTSKAGLLSAVDKLKLDGISAGANGVTAADIMCWGYLHRCNPIVTNGSLFLGSGVGIQTSNHEGLLVDGPSSGTWTGVAGCNWAVGSLDKSGVIRSNASSLVHYRDDGRSAIIWDSVNDGSGSELDADLLDGHHASYFATSSQLTSVQSLIPGEATTSVAGKVMLSTSIGTSASDSTVPTTLATRSAIQSAVNAMKDAVSIGQNENNTVITVKNSDNCYSTQYKIIANCFLPQNDMSKTAPSMLFALDTFVSGCNQIRSMSVNNGKLSITARNGTTYRISLDLNT